MKILRDYEGRIIRLTEERWQHIREHPEMSRSLSDIGRILLHPEQVVESRADSEVRLYYRYFFGSPVGDKYLCVVVKMHAHDAFVLTAYYTDAIKRGPRLWPK